MTQGLMTIGLVSWLVSRIDATTIAAISSVPISIFASAVLVFSFSQFWCAARLRMLIAAGARLPRLPRFGYLLRLTLSTFFISNFLPGTIGGDVVKAIALTRNDIPLSRTVSTLLLDRLTNVAAAFLLSAVAVGIAAPNLIGRIHVNATLGLVLAGLAAAFVVLSVILLGRFSTMFAYVLRALRELALSWLRAPFAVGFAVLLSIASLLSAVGAQWILASRLGLPVTLLQLTAVICLIYVVTLAPITLNGIGLQEAGTVMLLVQFGAPQSLAVSFALLTRLLTLALSVVGAVVTAGDRQLFADLRQGAAGTRSSRFLKLFEESRLKRLIDYLPLPRQSRSRR
jgi:uncharacterized protein (TIRG00374 family)